MYVDRKRPSFAASPGSVRSPDHDAARSPAMFESDVTPSFIGVRAAVIDATAYLETIGVEAELRSAAELVLAEILNNVVEHARPDHICGYARLRIHKPARRIRCQIVDNGQPMPAGPLPKGQPVDPDTALRGIAENGMGWLLIRGFAENFSYERQDGINSLTFTIKDEHSSPDAAWTTQPEIDA